MKKYKLPAGSSGGIKVKRRWFGEEDRDLKYVQELIRDREEELGRALEIHSYPIHGGTYVRFGPYPDVYPETKTPESLKKWEINSPFFDMEMLDPSRRSRNTSGHLKTAMPVDLADMSHIVTGERNGLKEMVTFISFGGEDIAVPNHKVREVDGRPFVTLGDIIEAKRLQESYPFVMDPVQPIQFNGLKNMKWGGTRYIPEPHKHDLIVVRGTQWSIEFVCRKSACDFQTMAYRRIAVKAMLLSGYHYTSSFRVN